MHFSGAESIKKLDIQYELGSAFFSAGFAAAMTNPMVFLSLASQGRVPLTSVFSVSSLSALSLLKVL